MRSLLVVAVVLLTVHVNAEEPPTSPPPSPADGKAPQIIAVDLKLIEISRSKIRQQGFDFAKFNGKEGSTIDGLQAFDEAPTSAIIEFVDALAKNKVAHVLANPRVVTLDGREASLSIGSQVERTVGNDTHFVQLGTNLSVVPKLVSGDRVQLDVRLEWVGKVPLATDSSAKNNTRKYEVQTSIATTFGKSTLLTRSLEMEASKDGAEETILLLVVTPELVKATANAKGPTVK
jgi:Flp pilus assembly secretin CpaC